MARRGLGYCFAAVIALVGSLLVAAPASAKPGSDTAPVPIPGGIDIPPLIHVFAPGPTDLGLMGEDVEPSTITNFSGESAYAVVTGNALGNDGKTYDVVLDMRFFDGVYVAADGSRHRGAFGFI